MRGTARTFTLSDLFDSRRAGVPYISYGFLTLCCLVTLPSQIWPDLYDVLGGLEPRRYPWQRLTAVFQHGWPGFPGIAHLALNAFLILECGRACERLLGKGRFLGLSIAAALANALVMGFAGGVNGSSLVIWSWGPPLFLALRAARKSEPTVGRTRAYIRIRGVLILMYGVIVALMALVPYLGGWRGDPLTALWLGNLYHLVATGMGIVFAVVWARFIRNRLAVDSGG